MTFHRMRTMHKYMLIDEIYWKYVCVATSEKAVRCRKKKMNEIYLQDERMMRRIRRKKWHWGQSKQGAAQSQFSRILFPHFQFRSPLGLFSFGKRFQYPIVMHRIWNLLFFVAPVKNDV